MTEQLCLKWTDFHSCIVNALDSLKCSEDLVDVTLTCEGQNIKAHKVILSACSPYFRGVFKENPCRHPIIILKGVLAADIVRLLAYMYQGEVQVQEAELSSFLQTAELLQIKGLTQPPTQAKKPALNTSPATLLSMHSKKITSQLLVNSKKCSCSKEAPSVTTKSPSSGANKKRRNSASEDGSKKHKPNKEKAGGGGRSSEDVGEARKAEESPNADGTPATEGSASTEITQLPLNVQVKHELEDVSSDTEEITDRENPTRSDPDPPDNIYESSMLARSLMSGVSLKSDSCLNPPLPKSMFPCQPTACPEETQVKTERASPHPDAAELEPEVLISEQGEPHKPGTSKQARTEPAASSAAFAQSNHAAICGDCPHCGTKYSNQSALKYHVRLMHSDLTNRLCCYLCPRSFTMRDTFKEHMWSTHGQRN